MSGVAITNNPEESRYEARVGGVLAGFADYQAARELCVLTHTEVDESFEGQGIGGALAKAALDDIRDRGSKVLLVCPFITKWVSRHPEYNDVVYGAPPSKVTD